MSLLGHKLNPYSWFIVATGYSCHFPFVSIFLDVIHVLCLNDMASKEPNKGFQEKKKVFTSFLSHEAVNFLPLLRGSMAKANPPKERSFLCY